MNGATAWEPRSARTGSRWRHVWAESGKAVQAKRQRAAADFEDREGEAVGLDHAISWAGLLLLRDIRCACCSLWAAAAVWMPFSRSQRRPL